MKKIILSLLLFPLSFFGQTCTYPFANTVKDIVETNDGNFVFCSGDFKTTKVDFNFDTIWHQDYFDNTGRSLTKIQSTFDGGFIGAVYNSGNYLYKMNSLGDTLWTNEFQIFFGPFGGGINVFEIIQTADSGFAFIGIFGFHGTVSSILVKTDPLGNVLWTKNIAIPNSSSYGRKIRTLLETTNGDLILSGYVETFSTTNNNFSLLYKFSNLGDSIWAKNYENFEFNSLQIDNSDNIIIGAELSDSLNNKETRIIKANSFGDTIWTKKIFTNKLNCIELTASGYIFGGYIESVLNNKSPYLLKTNFNGDSLWTRIYEEDSLDRTIKKIFKLGNYGYLLLGDSVFNSSFYNKNINYRTQVDSLGYCPGVNNCNTVYVIDTLNTNVADIQYQNINPHTYLAILDTFPQFSNPNCDSIVSTYRQFIYNPNYCTDTILTYDTIFNQIYDTTTAYDTLITFDTLITYDTVFNQIYDTTIVFDTLNISVIDTSYISISVTDTLYIDITVTGMTSIDNTITVYPNPANDVVIIDNGNYSIMNNYNLMIFNSLSQQVFFSQINTQQFQIPVSSIGAEGTYIIRIFDSSNNIVKTKYLILN